MAATEKRARIAGPFWRRIRTFEALAVPDYRLLLAGQLNSSLGQWMDQVTRTWLIYQLTGSPLDLGLVTAARSLPLLLFGVAAGVYADRSGRKAQLVIAQATNALLNLALAVLVLTGAVEPWHVYATGFLAGTVQAFQQPARQTIISDVVGRGQLLNALALNSVVLQVARSVGPGLAGLLIAVIGVHGSYFVQAVMFGFATWWTVQLHVPQRAEDALRVRREPFLTSLKGGAQFLLGHRQIRGLMILALGTFTLAMPYTSLMPVFAEDVLHGGAQLQGLILGTVGAGALCGALAVASIPRSGGYAWAVCTGAIAFAMGVMGFSLSHWVPLSLGMALLIGVFGTTYQTQDQTMLQVITPNHLRGRVMSIYLLYRGLGPAGAALAGVLASAVGAPAASFSMSAAAAVVALIVTVATPGLWKLSVPLDADPGAMEG